MKTPKKTLKCFLSALMVLCLVLLSAPLMALEDDSVSMTAAEDPRESILLVTLGVEDDEGNYLPIIAGSCFLINDEYVLTNRHVVAADENLADLQLATGLDSLRANDPHIKIYVYVNRDMKISATMHESVNSVDLDFAAVKLSRTIDRKPIALGDSSVVQQKDAVTALGFPADSLETKNYNTKEDVSVVSGSVSKVADSSMDVIEHTAPLNDGNSGGPLLDENDAVIGVNSFKSETKNYAYAINYIKQALSDFQIPYIDGSGALAPTSADADDAAADDEAVAATVDLTSLQNTISDAKSMNVDDYTEDSVAALDDAIGQAEAVVAKGADNLTQEEVNSTEDALNDAVNNLEPKGGPSLLLIAIIAAVVVVVVAVIVVVIVMSSKKKKTKTGMGPVPPIPPIDAGTPSSPTTPDFRSLSPPTPPDGVGETTLLDDGGGETTLLSGAGAAYLIRKKNGEKISINLPNFKIGKERRRVNYCVSDNTSVSRIHCEIVKKGSDYYAVDQGATNYTFVNGVQLSPHKESLLSDQSVLKLADEEFEFHLS